MAVPTTSFASWHILSPQHRLPPRGGREDALKAIAVGYFGYPDLFTPSDAGDDVLPGDRVLKVVNVAGHQVNVFLGAPRIADRLPYVNQRIAQMVRESHIVALQGILPEHAAALREQFQRTHDTYFKNTEADPGSVIIVPKSVRVIRERQVNAVMDARRRPVQVVDLQAQDGRIVSVASVHLLYPSGRSRDEQDNAYHGEVRHVVEQIRLPQWQGRHVIVLTGHFNAETERRLRIGVSPDINLYHDPSMIRPGGRFYNVGQRGGPLAMENSQHQVVDLAATIPLAAPLEADPVSHGSEHPVLRGTFAFQLQERGVEPIPDPFAAAPPFGGVGVGPAGEGADAPVAERQPPLQRAFLVAQRVALAVLRFIGQIFNGLTGALLNFFANGAPQQALARAGARPPGVEGVEPLARPAAAAPLGGGRGIEGIAALEGVEHPDRLAAAPPLGGVGVGPIVDADPAEGWPLLQRAFLVTQRVALAVLRFIGHTFNAMGRALLNFVDGAPQPVRALAGARPPGVEDVEPLARPAAIEDMAALEGVEYPDRLAAAAPLGGERVGPILDADPAEGQPPFQRAFLVAQQVALPVLRFVGQTFNAMGRALLNFANGAPQQAPVVARDPAPVEGGELP